MALLRELSMESILSRIAAVLIYAALHGSLLAVLALLLGDRRPARDGRLYPNPFTQISVWGVAIGALFSISWIRPMRYNAQAIRMGAWGVVLVILVSSAMLLACVPLIDLMRGLMLMLPRTGGYVVLQVANDLQIIAAGSAILNLLPIPGLAMGAVYAAIWPEREKRLLRQEPIGLALVIAALVAGIVPSFGSFVVPYLSLI